MNWGSWSEFWGMGGYAVYVWGSYAVTMAFIVTELVLLRFRRRTILQHLGRMHRAPKRGDHETKD